MADRFLVGMLGILVVVALPFWRSPTSGPLPLLADAPVDVSNTLADALPPGSRVFQSQRWGSWLEYANPIILVAVDSRIELFPASMWADYEVVLAGRPGWSDILDRWSVDAIAVIPAEAAGLLDHVELDPGWREILGEDGAAVFERSAGAGVP